MWQKVDVDSLSLPTVHEVGVPYAGSDEQPLLQPVLPSSEDLSSVTTTGSVACTLCQKSIEKKHMRVHCGVHIRAHSARIRVSEPCGLCLGDKCVAYLQTKPGGARPQPAVCCRLLAPESFSASGEPDPTKGFTFQSGGAERCTPEAPTTNILLLCPRCHTPPPLAPTTSH